MTHDEHAYATGGTPLNYVAYTDLLMSAATRHDSELKLPAQRSRRTVNVATSMPYGFDEADNFDSGFVDDGGAFFMEEPHDASYHAYVTEQRHGYIPSEVWSQLPKSAQEILQNAHQPQGSKTNAMPHQRHQVKMHHLDEISEPEEQLEPVNETFHGKDDVSQEAGTTLIVHLTKQKKMHLGDIQNVLALAQKGKQTITIHHKILWS